MQRTSTGVPREATDGRMLPLDRPQPDPCSRRVCAHPEHPRGLDYDRERPDFRPQYPGGGGYAAYAFNVGYTRAMLQAACQC